jgi:hypothetical protein
MAEVYFHNLRPVRNVDEKKNSGQGEVVLTDGPASPTFPNWQEEEEERQTEIR